MLQSPTISGQSTAGNEIELRLSAGTYDATTSGITRRRRSLSVQTSLRHFDNTTFVTGHPSAIHVVGDPGTILTGALTASNESLFDMGSGGSATFDGLTFVGFDTAPVFTVRAGAASLRTCNFSANAGGALTLVDGDVTIENSTLVGNGRLSVTRGGAIAVLGGTLDVRSSTLAQNRALDGGALYASAGMVTFRRSTMSENEASVAGGALSVDGSRPWLGQCTHSHAMHVGHSSH
jgi:hypothetical protein